MLRTIEIISRHMGKIAFKCKGEPRSVIFEDKGEVGVALVDNDEAEVFLRVGKPDYWKEDAIEVNTSAVTKRRHQEVIADIKVAETAEAVDALTAGDDRPSVLSAAEIRKEELATPKQ